MAKKTYPVEEALLRKISLPGSLRQSMFELKQREKGRLECKGSPGSPEKPLEGWALLGVVMGFGPCLLLLLLLLFIARQEVDEVVVHRFPDWN